MAQIAGQGRLLVRLIVIKKLLLAGALFAISLAAVFGDVHYAEPVSYTHLTLPTKA